MADIPLEAFARMMIIDFDDTLFDTHRFKRERQEALARVGVSRDAYEETYRLARNTAHGVCTYSDDRHADVLGVRGYDTDSVLGALKNVSDRVGEFLYQDAIAFLTAMRVTEKDMILLSLGDPAFQEFKVKGAGIDTYFDRMYMVDDTKEHVLAKILSAVPGYAWFVNDKVEETRQLIDIFPKLRPVLKISPAFRGDEYERSGIPHFHTLNEIHAYVRQKQA